MVMNRLKIVAHASRSITWAASINYNCNTYLIKLAWYSAAISRKFEQLNFSAEIGGTIGLYVGASILTIVETVVFFFEKKTRAFITHKETQGDGDGCENSMVSTSTFIINTDDCDNLYLAVPTAVNNGNTRA